MIYSTLGDKGVKDFGEDSEDDDDDYTVPAEKTLSAAGAIYLVSVLEFIGEHCLLVVTRNTFDRLAAENSYDDPSSATDPVIIEVADIKRSIAEDELTTRIWRKWKRSEKLLEAMSSVSATRSRRTVANEPSFTFDLMASSNFDTRRNSIMSAPDMSRGDSNQSNDSRSQSLPPPGSPIKSQARKNRHRHSKVYLESGKETVRSRGSVTELKETLEERGIIFPESPREPTEIAVQRFSRSMSPRDSRLSSLTEGSYETWGRRSSRDGVVLPSQRPADEDDAATDYQDAIDTPRRVSADSTVERDDDPLKTPTLEDKPKFNEDDGYVMGGDDGLDVFHFNFNLLTVSFLSGRPKHL
jgi:hypothetical protein